MVTVGKVIVNEVELFPVVGVARVLPAVGVPEQAGADVAVNATG